jgi:Tat protein secretion system quality control protein TatD with DNase activity
MFFPVLLRVIRAIRGQTPCLLLFDHTFPGQRGSLEIEQNGNFQAGDIQIPADRLMIEADAPFLVPRSLPAKPKDGRHEPAFLTHVLRTVTDYLGKPAAEVAETTTRTARQFFQLDRN